MLAGDLPVSFSGVGVREGAAAFLLSSYGVPSSAAVDATLLWFVFAVLVPAGLGSLWLIAERIRMRMRRSDLNAHRSEHLWAPVTSTLPLLGSFGEGIATAPGHAGGEVLENGQ